VDDVFQGRLVLLLRLDQLRPVAAAKEMVLATVLLVESARVAAVQVSHARVEVRGRGLDDEVVVVPHQAARVQAPAVAPFDASQQVEEDDAVLAVEHDRCAVVPAGHDVVVGTGEEWAMGSSHSVDRSSARGRFRPTRASCPTSASVQSRARHETGVEETAPIGACRVGTRALRPSHVPGTRLASRRRPLSGRVGSGNALRARPGGARRRLWSVRGAGATGSSRGPGAVFAGTACPCASWRGSGRPHRRVRPTRSAPR
jgi:hypothetical protein